MSLTVSDYLAQRLREWGAERVFAYPGEGIDGLLAAWARGGSEPEFVHPYGAQPAPAQCAGRVGVCGATSGPGAIPLLNGLYEAKLDRVPMVAIVGRAEDSAMDGFYQRQVDLLGLFEDVASECCETVAVPTQLPSALDQAMRVAAAKRTVTAVIVPADVLGGAVPELKGAEAGWASSEAW